MSNLGNEYTDESSLETRLRQQLAKPSATHADPQILLAIKERAAASSNGTQQALSRRGYTAVLAVASIAIGLIVFTAISSGVGSPPIEPTNSSGPSIPPGPSYWWLVVALFAAVALVVWLHRRVERPLLTYGTALACAGLLFWVAMVIPYARAGSRLAATAPELEGYELEAANVPWPSIDGLTLAQLRYRPNPGTEAISDDPGASNGYLALGRRLGFNGVGQLQGRCLERATGNPFDAELYCIDPQAGSELVVRATVFDIDGLLIGRDLGLPIMALGSGMVGLDAIFALVERRRKARKRRSA